MARRVEDRRNPGREQEKALVLAFQSGDQAAFESIVSTCRPTAERICRRLLINPADVEEAVQETLVRAYQGLPRFNGSYALTAWIARIATNVSLDILRASSRRPQNGGPLDPNMETPVDHQPNGDRDPEEILEQVLEAEQVRDVLASLPERHRTALVLREFEGMSHRRIAEMLDTSPQRVKALIHRAKAGFRRAWRNDQHPERLAAFAPLLTPINWVRKLFGRAPEFDYSTTSAAATASTVVASPAAHSFVTIASERASVLATVMLAGTVGFAMQHAPNPSRAADRPHEVEVVAEPPMEEAVVKPVLRERDKPKPGPEETESAPVAEPTVTPTPTPTPSPTPTGNAAVAPEGSAGPQEVKPSPSIPPPPAYSASFSTSGFSSQDQCDCGPFTLGNNTLEGSPGTSVSFAQALSGAVQDADGDNAWDSRVTLEGTAGEHGSLTTTFTLITPRGTYDYTGQATLTGAVQENGVWKYSFEGAYSVQSGPGGFDQIPRSGTLRVNLAWHVNGAPVATSLTLA